MSVSRRQKPEILYNMTLGIIFDINKEHTYLSSYLAVDQQRVQKKARPKSAVKKTTDPR